MQENIKQVIVKNTVRKEFKTAPIFQWDTGHVLVFEGFDLPEAFQVHFAFSESGESVPQIGSNDQVTVPDALVEDGRMIYAWLYISTEDAGLTKFVILMPVNRRAKPTHQVPPPVEQSEIDQAIAALNTGVARAETAAENAETAEENASQYAENAYNSSVAAANAAESASGDARTATQKAQEAITAALDADRKAQNASESAQLASQKASEASGYADGLAEAVRTANEAKQTAVNKATEANQSASNATQKAQEATSAASSASQSATDADTARRAAEAAKNTVHADAEAAVAAKDTAVQKAGEASQSATNAAQSAQAAAQTAAQFEQDITELKSDIESKQTAPATPGTAGQVLGLDAQLHPVWVDQTGGGSVDDSALAPVIKSTASGEIASFPDGADNRLIDSLVVNVEPVQDLHGQDAPYPPGGNTNKWDEQTLNGYYDSNGEYVSISGQLCTKNMIAVSPETEYRIVIGSFIVGSSVSPAVCEYDSNKTFISRTGLSSATFTTTADCHYINLNVSAQYGSEYKNDIAVNYPSSVTTYSPYSNICPISGWTGANVTRTGKNLWNGTLADGVNTVFETKPGQTYTVSAKLKGTSDRYLYLRSSTDGFQNNAELVGRIIAAQIVKTVTFTAEAGKEYALWSNATYAEADQIQIEPGSTASSYEPYQGRTVPVSWETEAGTVLGGTVDVISGEISSGLTKYKLKDVSNITQYIQTADGYCYVLTPDLNSIKTPISANEVMSSVYAPVNPNSINASSNAGLIGVYISRSNRFILATSTATSVEDFIAELVAYDAEIVLPLAEPVSYQLSENELATLLGQNNIFADCGSIASVEYSADTKLYIDNKLAQLAAQIVS